MRDVPGITVYGKPGCHLCEQAEGLVASIARELGRRYRTVDIQSAPDLFEAYRYRIPVVQIDGGPTLDWPVTAGQIRRAVEAAGRS